MPELGQNCLTVGRGVYILSLKRTLAEEEAGVKIRSPFLGIMVKF